MPDTFTLFSYPNPAQHAMSPNIPCLSEDAPHFPRFQLSLLRFLAELVTDTVCTAQTTTYYVQHSTGCCFPSLISSNRDLLLQTVIPNITTVVSPALSTALSPEQVFSRYMITAWRMINWKVSLSEWRSIIYHSYFFVPCWDGMNISS